LQGLSRQSHDEKKQVIDAGDDHLAKRTENEDGTCTEAASVGGLSPEMGGISVSNSQINHQQMRINTLRGLGSLAVRC